MLTTRQVYEQLSAFVLKHGSQTKAAKALGVSPSYLNDMLQGKRAISSKVLERLKLRKVTTYERVA